MPTIEQVCRWGGEANGVTERIGSRFFRRQQREHAGRYLRGLISRVERKNGWQLAEQLGDSTPVNLQHFIARSEWDAEAVRDDLRNYVVEQLGDSEGVLIVDETGFLKKGTKSVGVKRQYSGTAGRIENCQIGVFLAYRSVHGHALVDRALYVVPRGMCPTPVRFATKQTLAREMIASALAAQIPAAWLTADEVYGSEYKFRRFCEDCRLNYVVAISSTTHLAVGFKRQAVRKYLSEIPPDAWHSMSCGAGAKGQREYDWAFLTWPHYEQKTHARGCLVRRSLDESREHAFYFTYAPRGPSLAKLVQVAGSLWAIEECFEQAKQETGLDKYEVRSWLGWHRHITLSLLAHATLAVVRAQASQPSAPKKRATSFR